MTDFYSKNIHVVTNRWPKLAALIDDSDPNSLKVNLVEGLNTTLSVNDIQLTSRHDREFESRVQIENVCFEDTVYVYGIGLGDVPKALLKLNTLKRLNVYILNETIFALVISLLDHSDWLSDPRVELSLAGWQPEINSPFILQPAELFLASDLNSKIRDRLVAESEVEFVNRKTPEQIQFQQDRIASNHRFLEKDEDVSALFGRFVGQDLFILASGPTLAQHLIKLEQIFKAEKRPVFFALDTALKSLVAAGITPDYVITIDRAINTKHFPDPMPNGSQLIYFPMALPTVLQNWTDKRYAAYSLNHMYDEIYEKYPKARVFSSGSVIHPAVDIAVKMGVKTITFFGADFSFPGNKTHTGWNDGVLGLPASAAKHWVLNGRGERVKTLLNFRSYLCSLERFISFHPEVMFYNTSYEGAHIEGTSYHPEFCK